MSSEKMIEIHLRRARRKVCDASISFTVCGRENLRCVMPVCRLGAANAAILLFQIEKVRCLWRRAFFFWGKIL
jgi:hypothetical protein